MKFLLVFLLSCGLIGCAARSYPKRIDMSKWPPGTTRLMIDGVACRTEVAEENGQVIGLAKNCSCDFPEQALDMKTDQVYIKCQVPSK